MSVEELKRTIAVQRDLLAEREAEIRRLLKNQEDDGSNDDGENEDDDGDGDDEDENMEDAPFWEASSSESESIPEAIYDPYDNVFRCTSCTFEVVQGICQICGTKHYYDPEHWEKDIENVYSTLTTDDTYVQEDRYTAPRGTTPLLPKNPVASSFPLPTYSVEEYSQLLRRGATRAMIAQFSLDFDETTGITAWADEEPFHSYSGPAMQKGHRWKIQLGRRVQLDPDDADGSIFIEKLVEEISHSYNIWETVRDESQGRPTGITRLIAEVDPGEGEDDDDDDEDEWRYNTKFNEPNTSKLAKEAGKFVEDILREEREALDRKGPPALWVRDEYESAEEHGPEGTDLDEEEPEDRGYESETNWSEMDPTDAEKALIILAENAQLAQAPKIEEEQDSSVTHQNSVFEDKAKDSTVEAREESESDGEDSDADVPGSDWDSNDEDL